MRVLFWKIGFVFSAVMLMALPADAQNFSRNLNLTKGGAIEIVNNFGRVNAAARSNEENSSTGTVEKNVTLTASSEQGVSESEIKIIETGGKIRVETAPGDAKKRIDLEIELPERTNLKVQTNEGEVRISGNLATIEVKTETGTIAADIPLDDVAYDFLWTASRPRFLSDVELKEVKEKSAGRFEIKGTINEESPNSKVQNSQPEEDPNETAETPSGDDYAANNKSTKEKKSKEKKNKTKPVDQTAKTVSLNFTTARGIILLNVLPSEVPSDLRERPLTNAAKAIIRSGDGLLMEAIRRAAPKYFGDYAATLPPLKKEPVLSQSTNNQKGANSQIKKVLVRVMDINNRAVADLQKDDFEVLEAGEQREIMSVEPVTAPFNLVLLLDVSGSIENYVDFIRKAARAFVETADKNDKIAIIIFSEDVKQVSTFTSDKGQLSESLDTFDAGGGTAFYDALAFALTDTLRPLRGERTAIVVLSDGDDNHSFLPFDALLGSIQESGALIYPLYVPSGLIAASKTAEVNAGIDPLRTKYMTLTSKAEAEGEKLAQISGGVYYPIHQLGEIQKAYDEIVRQLRTAYTITFRSNIVETRENRASPRLKVKVKRDNAFVKLGSVVEVPSDVSEIKTNK